MTAIALAFEIAIVHARGRQLRLVFPAWKFQARLAWYVCHTSYTEMRSKRLHNG